MLRVCRVARQATKPATNLKQSSKNAFGPVMEPKKQEERIQGRVVGKLGVEQREYPDPKHHYNRDFDRQLQDGENKRGWRLVSYAQRLVDGMAEDVANLNKDKSRATDVDRPINDKSTAGRMVSDPVWANQAAKNKHESPKRDSVEAADLDQASTAKKDLRQYMELKHAMSLLGFTDDDLPGIKSKDVEAAWAIRYRNMAAARDKEEVTAAAEFMLEFVDSQLARAHEKVYYMKKLAEARDDVDATLRRDRQVFWGNVSEIFGYSQLYLLVVLGGAIYVVYRRSSNESFVVEKIYRRFATGFSAPANYEPAPNYLTRYRDTPTSYDLLKNEKYGTEVNNITQRQGMQIRDELEKRDDLLLAEAQRYDPKALQAKREDEHAHSLEIHHYLTDPTQIGALARGFIPQLPHEMLANLFLEKNEK